MIDARTLSEDTLIQTDVCIVGAGAAGITLARECIGRPFRVCLLESGGLGYDQETQALYKGENVGLRYFPLDATRLRFFGGSTNHWAGFCQPYDDIDFEARDWVPYSGWPFSKAHLLPFYERAQTVCQLGPLPYDPAVWETSDRPRLPFSHDRVSTTIFQFSPPTRFGQVYRNELDHAENISIYLHANVVDIETTENARTVSRLRVACLHGRQFWVAARIFILATGGIENARLLLLANSVSPAGLGNQHDLVGRFFMDHINLLSGLVLPSNPYTGIELYLPHAHSVHKRSIVAALALSAETLRREQLLNARVTLEPLMFKSVGTLKRLVQGVRQRAVGDFVKHLGSMIADIDGVALAVYGKLVKGHFPVKMVRLDNQGEPAPNPESCITLSAERDSLGKNRARLQWRLSALDKHSLRRTQEILGQELGRTGLGRLQIELDQDDTVWPPNVTAGHHHMGTTRMHVDPKQGVVDSNCRVHDMENLFIAGSSVFPTSGGVNPTLTIVALAIRLTDHVKGLMQ